MPAGPPAPARQVFHLIEEEPIATGRAPALEQAGARKLTDALRTHA